MPMEKKTWSEPMLIELVRGAPEEAMLVACRVGEPVGFSHPDTTGGSCICPDIDPCTPCVTMAAS